VDVTAVILEALEAKAVTRDKSLYIRVSDDEQETVSRTAAGVGLTVQDFGRTIILAACKELATAGPPEKKESSHD
jgi:uncharacterized protein (DUF1778 family)